MSEEEEFIKSKFSVVDSEITEDLVKTLDEHYDIWKSFLAVLPLDIRCKFSEEDLQSKKGWVPGMLQRTPAGRLVDGLSDLNATVEHFIFWLEKINMDDALMHIKPDEPLEILDQPPGNLLVRAGEPLHLHCWARGFPRPTYQWAKDGVQLSQQTSSKLILEKACLEDAGDYECQVQNLDRLSGKARAPCYSQCCCVTVAPCLHKSPTRGRPPRIDLQPVAPGQLVAQGASIVLECRASGDGPLSYQWFKDKADIPGEISEELHLSRLVPDEETPGHSWKYYCLVENSWGRIFSDTVTITLDAPNDQTQYAARDKVALLFANEHYQHLESFKLPSSDVATLSAILKRQNFRVMAYLDLTLSEMRNALDLFCKQLDKGVYGLFYYAGHGFEEHGQCYMQPADATDSYLKEESLCVNLVAESMQRRGPSLCALLLDMCRERPPIPQVGRTFQTNRFKDIIFGYATSFLGEAMEVQGHPNGIYMQYLQKHLQKKKNLFLVLYDVSQAMAQDQIASRHGQIPWVEGNNWTTKTLCDPILDPLPQKAALDAHWRACCACPKPRSYENRLLQFSMTFEPHKASFCNAMTMRLQVHKMSSAANTSIKLKATFQQDSGDQVAVTYSSSSDAYTIRDLQRIRSPLRCELSLVDSRTGQDLGTGPVTVLQFDSLPIRTLGLAENRLDDSSLL